MMEDQINANGGINGHPVDVIVYNYESDAVQVRHIRREAHLLRTRWWQ